MKRTLFATALVAGTACAAFAQTNEMQDSTGVKLSQAECESLWNQASPDGAPISEAQAAPYITNFKAANPDGDTTIEQPVFSKACEDGLVKGSASTGAASGESGANKAEELPTMKSDENPSDQN